MECQIVSWIWSPVVAVARNSNSCEVNIIYTDFLTRIIMKVEQNYNDENVKLHYNIIQREEHEKNATGKNNNFVVIR